jgi:hypothetical protein
VCIVRNRQKASFFSEEKEAKRLLCPRGCSTMLALAGNAWTGAESKSFLVLFFKKELLPSS